MSLAIFDLDHTLIAADSGDQWIEFLTEQGALDAANCLPQLRRFQDEYDAGVLDIHEFLGFHAKTLASHDSATLKQWRIKYMEDRIKPLISAKARALVEQHRGCGHTLIMITATIHFVASPIASTFGMEHLLASEATLVNGQFDGTLSGVPCFQGGKVDRLQAWIRKQDKSLHDSWFYSDSHNDLPLLSKVDHPVAVDPDPTLAEHASRHGWSIVKLA
ncbi:MAG: HAD family phosphatase [Gammaproteobacteria bacterium]|nr:HAD family phosphatase [Gammaproteobacteria bacterium]